MKKKTLLVIVALLCLTTVLAVSSNTVNADSIDLKGNYLYDRQGKAHKIPITRRDTRSRVQLSVWLS